LPSGPGVCHVVAVNTDMLVNSRDALLKEIEVLSTLFEHKLSTIVLSDCECDTILMSRLADGNDDTVITDTVPTASPLSVFLGMTDLVDRRFLLHPACADLFACLRHLHAHKTASTSAVVVLPKQPGVA
jgi:hypothetical protein